MLEKLKFIEIKVGIYIYKKKTANVTVAMELTVATGTETDGRNGTIYTRNCVTVF